MKWKYRSFISNLETTEPPLKKEVSDGRKQLQIWSTKKHRQKQPKTIGWTNQPTNKYNLLKKLDELESTVLGNHRNSKKSPSCPRTELILPGRARGWQQEAGSWMWFPNGVGRIVALPIPSVYGICLPTFSWFLWFNVCIGKYTYPLDGMGYGHTK